MKKVSIILNILLVVFICYQNFLQPEPVEGIVFEELTVEQALKKAKKENKSVFIDFYTNGCGPCERLKREIFIRNQVGDVYNKKYVNLKVNVEDFPALGKKYKITNYPTLMYIDNKGNIMHRFAGFKNVDEFIAESHKADKYPYKLLQRWETEEHTPELEWEYLNLMEEMYNMEVWEPLALELCKKKDNPYDKEAFDILKKRIYDTNHPHFKFIYEHHEQFRKNVGYSVDSLISAHAVLSVRLEIRGKDRLKDAFEKLDQLDGDYKTMGMEVAKAEEFLYDKNVNEYVNRVTEISRKYGERFEYVNYFITEGWMFFDLYTSKLTTTQIQKLKVIADKSYAYHSNLNSTLNRAFVYKKLGEEKEYNKLTANLDTTNFVAHAALQVFNQIK